MKKLWQDNAWEEYLYWQTKDKKTLKRINRLLDDIDRNGYHCIGKPEALKGNLAGYWSVRIDEKNSSSLSQVYTAAMLRSCRTLQKIPRNGSCQSWRITN